MYCGRVSRFYQRRLDSCGDNVLLLQLTSHLDSNIIGKCQLQRLKMIVTPVVSQTTTKRLVVAFYFLSEMFFFLFVRTNVNLLLYKNAVYKGL